MAALRYGDEVLHMYYAPIPQEVEEELPWPLQPGRGHPFDLDKEVPHFIVWPNETWVELVNVAKDEFEVDDAIAVFSTWRVQGESGNDVLDTHMTDRRAARLLERIPEGDFNVRIKFLRRRDGDWFKEGKMVPIREEARRGQGVVTITRRTRPRVLTGIDRVYYTR